MRGILGALIFTFTAVKWFSHYGYTGECLKPVSLRSCTVLTSQILCHTVKPKEKKIYFMADKVPHKLRKPQTVTDWSFRLVSCSYQAFPVILGQFTLVLISAYLRQASLIVV